MYRAIRLEIIVLEIRQENGQSSYAIDQPEYHAKAAALYRDLAESGMPVDDGRIVSVHQQHADRLRPVDPSA